MRWAPMSRSVAAARRRRSWITVALSLALLVTAAAVAAAHDMFLKPSRFFVTENSEVVVRLLNGTFTRSENSIARSRLRDVSLVTPTRRVPIDTAEWSTTGDTSTFHIHTRGAGTYVLGVSTRPSFIELSAEDFNLYLREDGIPDVLETRRRDGELGKPARERYHKHVKALVQVGEARSDHFSTVLGYPAELVPLENPYALRSGATLRVRTLVDGQPAANAYVIYGGTTATDAAIEAKSVRSDVHGLATITLSTAGTWYVKFIHMARMLGDTVDYESKWASLTFQVR
ncbi:MAG TPA: DUF4198 domain-containing protein [Gemmatimonadales bacterium]|nr:DUF4198 domain-containing protein [Gemmatimonadales bacterium]